VNTMVWVSLGIAAVAVVLVVVWLGVRMKSRQRRQMRLGRAFDRAQRVQGAGTGEQGQPYSLYGARSWHGDR